MYDDANGIRRRAIEGWGSNQPLITITLVEHVGQTPSLLALLNLSRFDSHEGCPATALVGAGYIADAHAQALLVTGAARLAAVVDPVPSRAERLAGQYRVPE